MNLSKYKFKLLLSNYGFQIIEKKPGRLPKPITDQEVNEVINYKFQFNVGYKRSANLLTKKGFNISQNTVNKIFANNGFFVCEGHKKRPSHRHRYFAYYRDQQWNTDLHEISMTIDQQTFKA